MKVAGNKYFVEKGIPSKFWMMDTTGKKILLGQASLSGIERLHISPKGNLFFNNKNDLYVIPSGDTLQLYLKDAGETVISEAVGNGTHNILSAWSDNRDNLYIATGNVIKQITKKKIINIIYRQW
jgi:hypothetical protein